MKTFTASEVVAILRAVVDRLEAADTAACEAGGDEDADVTGDRIVDAFVEALEG